MRWLILLLALTTVGCQFTSVVAGTDGWRFTNWSIANDQVGANITMSPVEDGAPGEREVTASLNMEVRPEGESASNQTVRDLGSTVGTFLIGGGAVAASPPAIVGGAGLMGLSELGRYLDAQDE